MPKIIYSENTKRKCIKLRKEFGDSTASYGIIQRHKLWVDYVNKSTLTTMEKEACKREFLNPRDIKKYNKGK